MTELCKLRVCIPVYVDAAISEVELRITEKGNRLFVPTNLIAQNRSTVKNVIFS